MNYIVEQIQTTPETGRKEAAAHLLQVFNHPDRSEIPCGYAYGTAIDARTVQEIRSYGVRFFDDIFRLLEGDVPEVYVKLRERFERNLTRMDELVSMTASERRDLPVHERFPYWDDFNKALKTRDMRYFSDLELFEFVPEFIAKGGFGSVYRVGHEGQYALKVYQPPREITMRPRFLQAGNRYLRRIAKNMTFNRGVITGPPFVRPHIMGLEEHDIHWLLMDFFDGRNVQQILNSKEPISIDDRRRCLMTYAEMLKGLHDKGLVFGDNGWDAVLINSSDVAICDYDFICPADDPTAIDRVVGHLAYHSRELLLNQPSGFISDLECFGHMIDTLILGSHVLTVRNEGYHRGRAKADRRTYHRARKAKLTPALREVVSGVISYPRDMTLTIDDFIDAIRIDLP